MSVTPNQITLYGSLKMPEADGVMVGGVPDITKRVAFYDLSTNGTVDVVSSSGSDTATKIQISGRDSTGVIQTPASVTVTGTTLIANAFGQSFSRLLYGIISGGNTVSGSTFPLANPGGTAAVGDVAAIATTRTISNHIAQAGSANTTGTTPPLLNLASGDGATIGALTNSGLGLVVYIKSGTGSGQLRYITVPYSSGAYGADFVAVNRDWGTIPDNTSHYDIAPGFLFEISPNPVTAITRIFATSQADVPGGSQRFFYEKVFVLNTNTTFALTSAQLAIFSETPSIPSGAALAIALDTALDGNVTSVTRQTLPLDTTGGALTFTSQTPSSTPVSVPSPGNLPSGNAAADAEGIWTRLTLNAGTTVYNGSLDYRTTGSTT